MIQDGQRYAGNGMGARQASIDRRVMQIRARRVRRVLPRIVAVARSTRSSIAKLLAIADALGAPVVDSRIAVAHMTVSLVAHRRDLPPGLPRDLVALLKDVVLTVDYDERRRSLRGRRPRLSSQQERNAVRLYRLLLVFFRDAGNRPVPECPDDAALLRRINQQVGHVPGAGQLGITEFGALTEESSPNRLAKLACALAYGISPGLVEKLVARYRSASSSQ